MDALPKENSIDGENQTLPRNEKENLLCEAFARVLNKKKIGIYDDFFLMGGDSISTLILLMQLQHHFHVNVMDIYNYRTPCQLAEKLMFSSKMIKNKLLEIMKDYENYSKIREDNTEIVNSNLNKYLSSIEKLSPDISPKKIKNVLLTGATGYLGCNLLHQLLICTDYNIYLLVRAKSDQLAVERVNNKYQRYFSSLLSESIYKDRTFVYCSDLEETDLGLSQHRYHELTHHIDSVIHTAASVKQFGEADAFFKVNVQATIHLLEFSKLTKAKDFHHVSTEYLLKNNVASSERWGNYCTEEHLPEHLCPPKDNIYLKTKLEAEQSVVKYRNDGVNASIYRVGNLAFMLKNMSVQENISTVGFAHWLKYLMQSRSIFTNAKIELSPVDLTASAIVKLFDKKCTTNSVYHVFNSNLFDLARFMKSDGSDGSDGELTVKVLTVSEFIQHIIDSLEKKENVELISRFLLVQGWLGVDGAHQFFQQINLKDQTQLILNHLDFEWPSITDAQFKKYLSHVF